jgi:hypothetical protein
MSKTPKKGKQAAPPKALVPVQPLASDFHEVIVLIEELVQWENSNNPRVINQALAEIARCVASRKIEQSEVRKETPFPIATLPLTGLSPAQA